MAWGEYQDLAEELFSDEEEPGITVTVTHTPKSIEPISGRVTDGTPVTCTTLAMILAKTLESDNDLEPNSLTRRRVRSLKLVAKGMSFEPRALDTISWTDQKTNTVQRGEILGCTPVGPDTTPIVYGVGVALS